MKFFKPSEYRCKCGRVTCPAPKELDPQLAFELDTLREAIGRPLYINSAIRCAAQNSKVGGVPESEHTLGQGVDLRAETSQARYEIIKLAIPRFRRIGIGKTFVHLGVSKDLPQSVACLY